MSATMIIQEGNGSSVSWSTITQARFCTRDSAAPADNDPCVVPSTGYYYSYWKTHRAYFSGGFTKVQNFRVFCSGVMKTNWSLGTGGMVLIGQRDSYTNGHGCPVGNYQQAAGTQGTTGYYIGDGTNGHGYYKSQTGKVADFDGYVSATPCLVDLYGPGGSGYTSEGGSYAWILQAKLSSTATQGDKANETLTLRWDEY
jgi:hypothetical protein